MKNISYNGYVFKTNEKILFSTYVENGRMRQCFEGSNDALIDVVYMLHEFLGKPAYIDHFQTGVAFVRVPESLVLIKTGEREFFFQKAWQKRLEDYLISPDKLELVGLKIRKINDSIYLESLKPISEAYIGIFKDAYNVKLCCVHSFECTHGAYYRYALECTNGVTLAGDCLVVCVGRTYHVGYDKNNSTWFRDWFREL